MAPFHLDRLDTLVENYGRNYVPALKALKKEEKKFPSNTYIKIMTAELNSRLDNFADAESILLQLVKSKPITATEVEALRRLYSAYALNTRRQGKRFLGCPPEVLAYFKAVQTSVKDGELATANKRPLDIFFQGAVHQVAWKDLVAVCRELKKSRDDPDIHLLGIYIFQKASQHLKDETFLAIAFARAAATEATKAVEGTMTKSTAGPRLDNLVHVNVVLSTYQAQRLIEASLHLFRCENERERPAIHEVVRANYFTYFKDKITLLRSLEEHEFLVEIALDVINHVSGRVSAGHEPSEFDFEVLDAGSLWPSLIMSANECAAQGNPTPRLNLGNTVKSALQLGLGKSHLSGPQLANLYFHENDGIEDLQPMYIDFLDNHCERGARFDDLCCFILQHPAHISKVVDTLQAHYSDDSGYMKRLVALQMEFSLRTSGKAGDSNFGYETAKSFVTRCLKVAQRGSQDNDPNHLQLIFLAAVTLLWMPSEHPWMHHVQALYLLAARGESEKAGDHRGNRVLLFKLSLCLGFGTNALDIWGKLKTKHFLIESHGHLLFTRISTTYPTGSARPGVRNRPAYRESVLQELKYFEEFYEREVSEAVSVRGRCLQQYPSEQTRKQLEQVSAPKDREAVSLNGMIELLEKSNALQNSLTQVLLKIETRRVARCTNATISKSDDLPLCIHNLSSDKRDHTLLADGDYPKMQIPETVDVDVLGNPRPGKAYAAAFLVVENTMSLLYGDRPLAADALQFERFVEENAAVLEEETTSSEKSAIALWSTIRKLALAVLKAEEAQELRNGWEALSSSLQKIVQNPQEGAEPRAPCYVLGQHLPAYGNKALNTLYLAAEILSAVQKLCERAKERLKDSQSPVRKYLKAQDVASMSSLAKATAARLKESLSIIWDRNPVKKLSACLDDAFGQEIKDAIGQDEHYGQDDQILKGLSEALDDSMAGLRKVLERV